MYRRLEPKPEMIKAKGTSSEVECRCACGSKKTTDSKELAMANTATSQMSEHFKVNG